ncbi:MAG: flagellar hook-associated protein 3 [Spirochaetes bacterium]|nr:flagellar hook-associated protein 3 [Spirochaetota bacterium]
MKRVSTNLPNDNIQHFMRKQQVGLHRMQNKIASQSKVLNLRDNPIAAAHSVVLQSNISRLQKFAANAGEIQGRGRVAEAHLQGAIGIMHRINELAVQGANSTFSREDTVMMAEEVNQLLSELIEISNARYGDGTTMFSGDRTLSLAFRTTSSHVEGSGRSLVTNVEFIGTNRNSLTEISENSYIESSFPGNSVFWAENQVLMSSRNADSFFVREDSSIYVSGVTIDLRTGDNIHAVVAKINDSGAPVRASLDPVRNSIVLTTTQPHQIWIEDLGSGTVFQEIGLIGNITQRPPHNIANDARVSGGSLFDVVIRLRDSLFTGNVIEIGSGGLQGIQNGLNHLILQAGKLGARDERLQIIQNRLAHQTHEVQAMNSKLVDIDLAEAIMELRMLEHVHQASLQTAARILPPTLLDFLR